MIRPCHALLLSLAVAQFAYANDFPTQARVEVVVDFMRTTKAPPQGSMYKCSCAIDVIAPNVDYDTWVELSTVAKANTIGGGRGGGLRILEEWRKVVA